MRQKRIPRPDRIRCLRGLAFGWLDAKLLRNGWLSRLSTKELGVYTFLCLAADRSGVSFYRIERIGHELGIESTEVLRALAKLRKLDLVAFEPFHEGASDGFHQVLSLPESLPPKPKGREEILKALVGRLARPVEPKRNRPTRP